MSIMDPKGDGLKKMVRGDYLVPPWVKAGQRPPKDVPHPLKTFTDAIVLKNEQARKLPAAYILTVERGKKAEEDDFARSAERAKERGWKMYVMTSDHNPQWSAAAALAALLMSIN
jgi:hypothetical protein